MRFITIGQKVVGEIVQFVRTVDCDVVECVNCDSMDYLLAENVDIYCSECRQLACNIGWIELEKNDG